MQKYPLVSIIFPNFNGGKEPIECLTSIAKLVYPKNKLETIVIDNGSTDGSPKIIAKKFPAVILIKNIKNMGYVGAINQGLKKARGEYILIGNDDLVFAKDSVKKIVSYLVTHPDTGVAGGKIYYKNNPRKISSSGYMLNRWTGNIYSTPKSDITKEVDWIQGCALCIRRSILNKVGLLDKNFGLIYFEDTDLCWRVKNAGYKIIYLPDAEFWHGVTTTMNKNLPAKYYYWYKNKLQFIIKHLSLPQIISILSIQILVVSPYKILILGDGSGIPFLKGLFWNIVHLKAILRRRKKALIWLKRN